MNGARLGLLLLLLAFIGVPLLLPLSEPFADPAAFSAALEFRRTLALARNTDELVAGTLALTLPTGILLAALLYRTDLPFRRTLRFLVLWTVFVPLPLFASGWQTVLGSGGILQSAWWNPARERRRLSAVRPDRGRRGVPDRLRHLDSRGRRAAVGGVAGGPGVSLGRA